MQVFLTGGTGYIGQYLTRALCKRGWQVIALVRKPQSPQAHMLAEMGAQCIQGDVTEPASMHDAMQGADMVIHNAGWYELGVSARARATMYATNVTGTENVLALAQEFGIGRVIHVSSTTAFGHSGEQIRDESYQREHAYRSYYEQTKTEAHQIAQQYAARGLPVIIACPGPVMGPNDHSVWGYFLRLYVNGMMPPMAWSPRARYAGVHVADLAEGIALVAEKGRVGETYILAGDTATLREIMEFWSTKPGRFKVRFYAPAWLAAFMFAPLEPLQRMVGLPAFLSRETVRVGAMSHAFTSAKAQRELGWHYRPFATMWADIIERERNLMAERQNANIVARLNPLPIIKITDKITDT